MNFGNMMNMNSIIHKVALWVIKVSQGDLDVGCSSKFRLHAVTIVLTSQIEQWYVDFDLI